MTETARASALVERIPDGAPPTAGCLVAGWSAARRMAESAPQAETHLAPGVHDRGRPSVGVGQQISAGLARSSLTRPLGSQPQRPRETSDGALKVGGVPQGALTTLPPGAPTATETAANPPWTDGLAPMHRSLGLAPAPALTEAPWAIADTLSALRVHRPFGTAARVVR